MLSVDTHPDKPPTNRFPLRCSMKRTKVQKSRCCRVTPNSHAAGRIFSRPKLVYVLDVLNLLCERGVSDYPRKLFGSQLVD
jgi:hypothetical protein